MAKHEDDPQILVLQAIPESRPSSCSVISINSFSVYSVVGEYSLLWRQPSSVVGLIGNDKSAHE